MSTAFDESKELTYQAGEQAWSMSVVAVSILAVLLLFDAGVVVLIKSQRRGRERTDPTCGQYGYDLTGSGSDPCSECSAPFFEVRRLRHGALLPAL